VLPVRPGLALALRPRVPIGNIFRMLEVAYRLKSFELFEGITACASLEEFYERLANVLARSVLARARRGLYRAYLEQDERLMCVRGRVNVRRAIARPWDPALRCEYEEHTADIEDNQLLVAALGVAARSGLCTERVLPTVRNAYRAVAGFVTPARLSYTACLARLYHRLNEDYRPMHALCRFFLEHTGPSLDSGDHDMVPFVIHMPRLFELFVAEWMAANVSPPLGIEAQHNISFGDHDELNIQIDLVLSNTETGETLAVMDTKYKKPDKPSASDVEQVVAYASAQGCDEAVLIYPAPLPTPVDARFGEGGIRVRSLTFGLDGDLDEAGYRLLQQLSGTE
jgi:5-methylcytosine-specific restriction enzyme subunit McrC